MIPLPLRPPEPSSLAQQHSRRLPPLETAYRATGQLPGADDLVDYDVIKDDLHMWQSQKCAACEKWLENKFAHVDHYRPKLGTLPYWWLTWAWENLFLLCPNCNVNKGTQFPLSAGSVPLPPLQPPPGAEQPLLLNPAQEDPLVHVQFRPIVPAGQVFDPASAGAFVWTPVARNGSRRGSETIRIYRLDREDMRMAYRNQARQMQREIAPLLALLRQGALAEARPRARAMLAWFTDRRNHVYAGLALDILAACLTHIQRRQLRLSLRLR